MSSQILFLIASSLVAMAIAVHLWDRRRSDRNADVPAPQQISKSDRSSGASWLTRELHRGDLGALAGVVKGKDPDGPRRDQITRLRKRGFLNESGRGRPYVTAKGYAALALRLTSRRSRSGG